MSGAPVPECPGVESLLSPEMPPIGACVRLKKQ